MFRVNPRVLVPLEVLRIASISRRLCFGLIFFASLRAFDSTEYDKVPYLLVLQRLAFGLDHELAWLQ